MPIGSAICSSGTESPVTALKFAIKKSAYLQYPSRERLKSTDAAKKTLAGLLPRYFPIRRPNTYPCTIEAAMKTRYRGSPHP